MHREAFQRLACGSGATGNQARAGRRSCRSIQALLQLFRQCAVPSSRARSQPVPHVRSHIERLRGAPQRGAALKPARVARRGEKLDEGVLYDGKRGPGIGEQLVLVYARQHCALGRDLPPAGGRRPRPRRLPIAGHDRTAEIIDAWRERRDSAGSLRIDRGKVERLGPPGPGTSLNAL